jgi:hypothetical protein
MIQHVWHVQTRTFENIQGTLHEMDPNVETFFFAVILQGVDTLQN